MILNPKTIITILGKAIAVIVMITLVKGETFPVFEDSSRAITDDDSFLVELAHQPLPEFLDRSQKIRPGYYKILTEKTLVKGGTKKDPVEVEFTANTKVENGKLSLRQWSTLKGKDAVFREVTIEGDLDTYMSFENCVFENCVFRKKKGRHYGGDLLWSAKFKFQNCVFFESFFDHWSSKMIGVAAESCSFYAVNFPSFDFHDDAYEEVRDKQLSLNQCLMIDCTIGGSVLAFSDQCLLDDCRFREEARLPISKDIRPSLSVVAYATLSLPKNLPKKLECQWALVDYDTDKLKWGAELRPEYQRINPVRTWTDQKGRTLEGRIAGATAEYITFEISGTISKPVLLNDLCESDRAFVAQWKAVTIDNE